MNFEEFKSLFADACIENTVLVPNERQMEAFWCFTEYLLKVNAETNLTAIRNIPDIITKHYVDSLTVCELIPQNARVLDLGCGPGFPSVPLSIVRPDLSVVALDSTEKKIRFLNESAELLKNDRLLGVAGRAEDLEIRKRLGLFDVVVSRAVSRLNVLCELCMPYVRLSGKMIAMKGAKGEEELLEAQNAIKILGGEAKRYDRKIFLGETAEKRCLIEIQKVKETPKNYPRQYSAIVKKPL